MSYGETIRAAREKQGLTQPALGQELSPPVDGSTVSRWEGEIRKPSIEQANQLVLALGLQAASFFRQLGAGFTARRSAELPEELAELYLGLTEEQRVVALRLLRLLASEGARRR